MLYERVRCGSFKKETCGKRWVTVSFDETNGSGGVKFLINGGRRQEGLWEGGGGF